MPLISIITVSYNSEKTIERTIKSILYQSFKDYEYIIIDGNSKDDTINVVKQYEPLFEEGKLRWISEPDTGIYNAMNKGIKMAKGDIIGIVNSDDWLENDALQILADYIAKNKLDVKSPLILTGYMNFHYADGDIQLMKSSRKRMEDYCRVYRMGLNHPATFVTKEVYQTIGLFDENLRLYADADFVNICYKNGIPFCFIDAALSNMSDDGASNHITKQSLTDRKYILKKHSKSKFEYYSLYVNSLVYHYTKSLFPKTILKIIRKFN